MKNAKENRRGSVLVHALIFGTLLAVMMIPVLQFSRQVTRMAHSTRSSDQAFYAAEAGIARALSYVYGVGNGSVTGIFDDRFAVTEDQAFLPFGENWITLDEGIVADNNAELAARVRIWFEPTQGAWKIESVGRSERPRRNFRTVTVDIGAGSFARYVFFNSTSHSAIDGQRRWLAAGESFNGPVHSNRHLYVYGTFSPNNPLTFNSDVTIVNSEVRAGGGNYQNVQYNGLKDTNAAYVELPSDLGPLVNAAASGGIALPGDDPWLQSAPPDFADNDPVPGINNYKFEFDETGNVSYTNLDAMNYLIGQGMNSTAARSVTTFTRSLNGTNGAIVVRDGNAFVSGTVNGQATLAALANDATTGLVGPYSNQRSDGNIIVDGELIYNTHPQVNGQYDTSPSRDFELGTVTDMMGLIAERNFAVDGSFPAGGILDAHVMVTGQASPNPDVRDWGNTTGQISSAIGQDGGFYIEDGNQRDLSELWTGIPDGDPGNGNWTPGLWKFGDLNLTGGVVFFLRGQTANNYGGLDRRFVFDQRLMIQQPPFYPLTPDLNIRGWRDVAGASLD